MPTCRPRPILTPDRGASARFGGTWLFYMVILAMGSLTTWPLMSPPIFAQEQVRTIPFEGPEFFSHILHQKDLKPIRSFEEAQADPKDSIVIMFGNTLLLEHDRLFSRRLRRFLDEGGSLLVATDYPFHVPELSISIVGQRVQCAPADAYHEQVECPWVDYGSLPIPGLGTHHDHPLFRFLTKKIATNCPSFITVRPGAAPRQALVDLPKSSRILNGPDVMPELLNFDQIPRGGERPKAKKQKRFKIMPVPPVPMFVDGIPRSFCFMAGSARDAGPEGRTLFIAGHGMFMNGMMLQKDNNNFEFAVNAVHWLREGSNGHVRGKAYFVIDGEGVRDFNMNLTPPPPVPVPTLQHLNRLLRGLEEERFFQKIVADVFGGYLGRIVAILVGVVTFFLLLYGAKKLMDARGRLEPTVPVAVGAASAPVSPDALAERKQALLLKRDYFTECRQLALEWLRVEFNVTPERWHAQIAAEFSVQGLFWPPWKLRRQAALVLRLACGNGVSGASRREFFLLVEALRDLSAAREEGRVALIVEGKNVRQG
ncbi:MAG: hypothetical protein HYX68_05805 [Planctomycetes bacterium]|nr:hypothetical protein [Planctomycetota bacterium]